MSKKKNYHSVRLKCNSTVRICTCTNDIRVPECLHDSEIALTKCQVEILHTIDLFPYFPTHYSSGCTLARALSATFSYPPSNFCMTTDFSNLGERWRLVCWSMYHNTSSCMVDSGKKGLWSLVWSNKSVKEIDPWLQYICHNLVSHSLLDCVEK